MTRQEEKKNQRIAMLTSLGIHAVVFLMLFFMVAWRPPNPPLPQVGLELNFGLDDGGSGQVQPQEPVGTEGTEEEEPNQPEPQQTSPRPTEAEEVDVDEQEIVSKIESPIEVKEKKEEVKKPVVKPEPKKEEPVKNPDPDALYKKPNAPTNESTNTSNDGKKGKTGNHGDDKNSNGDEGNPEGSLDAKSLYGKQGGGGGPSLDLAGWQWDEIPKPVVPKSESGRVVFEIKVDDNGDIVSIKTVERSVSIDAEQACRREIQRLTFTKTGTNVPEFSTGRITFVISAR